MKKFLIQLASSAAFIGVFAFSAAGLSSLNTYMHGDLEKLTFLLFLLILALIPIAGALWVLMRIANFFSDIHAAARTIIEQDRLTG